MRQAPFRSTVPTGDLDAWMKEAEDELEAVFDFTLYQVPSLSFDAGVAVYEFSAMVGVDDGATYIRVEDGAVEVESG